ncbi:hypothetical protein DFP72DRAFT_384267 [Ephemerocybe angulata]|uniref:Uncharacterized protein n=1 Tax=Ephemerocybe angulata TaxID=980116 RepID=A0A8H6M625_9AGAR|nr:hypothetical protein DFP72DRAFT_384267 [Tulosesus angulatus]
MSAASSTISPSDPLTKSPQLPIAKLTAISRFKSLTGSLVPKREKRPKLQFPPPSWDIEDIQSATLPPTPAATTPSDPLPAQDSATRTTTSDDSTSEEHVEPITFAKRLRSMIELLPIPVMGSTTATPTATDVKANGVLEASAEPMSAPVPPGIDPKLVKMLSSEELMNGDAGADGKDRSPSIWNILAGLRRDDKDSAKLDDDGTSVGSSVEEESGGLMMYAPLEPKADSKVCLAEAEVVHENAEPHGHSATDKLKEILHPPTAESEPAMEKRVWVPSTTELSVLTAWWGYRLYLPPPVMAKLGASSVKAAARAAMITGALTWMLDKIPMAVIPVQFKPAVMMLKRLAPMASYVGVFIAWSWDRIRSLDDGNGVVLTATWLLPVALLPMAWDAGTIYRPILMPEPEEILKAEQAAKAEEERQSGKVHDGEEKESKDKKKNKSKFRFW